MHYTRRCIFISKSGWHEKSANLFSIIKAYKRNYFICILVQRNSTHNDDDDIHNISKEKYIIHKENMMYTIFLISSCFSYDF
jgi:hypothetical protein